MNLPQSHSLVAHNATSVPYYSFASFDALPFVKHGFSTRLGGVSSDIYASMNLSFTRGDSPEAVTENFKRFCKAIGTDYKNVVISAQEHHTTVISVTK